MRVHYAVLGTTLNFFDNNRSQYNQYSYNVRPDFNSTPTFDADNGLVQQGSYQPFDPHACVRTEQ